MTSPCEYCKNENKLKTFYDNDGAKGTLWNHEDEWWIEIIDSDMYAAIQIFNCPWCGRKLD